MPLPGKIGKLIFRKNVEKKLEAVHQLKRTSDYSQIHPPGPGQNLTEKKNPEHFDENFRRSKNTCETQCNFKKV